MVQLILVVIPRSLLNSFVLVGSLNYCHDWRCQLDILCPMTHLIYVHGEKIATVQIDQFLHINICRLLLIFKGRALSF